MTVAEPLEVHLYGRHVADVVDAGMGVATIRYTVDAVANPLGARLSLSLEPRENTHLALGIGGYWIRSLLPEGKALDWAVTEFGIARDDHFGFLEVLGRDVAGAASIRRVSADDTEAEPHYEALSLTEAARLVKRAHRIPLALDRERGVRLSLAGVQDKLLLHRAGSQYHLPINGVPSTLIVKPDPPLDGDSPRYSGVSSNELLCLVLAREAGFDAASAHVEDFDGTPALVVVRYDRAIGVDGEVTRIHQEDFLSALGVDPLLKYERPQSHKHAPTGGWATAPTFSNRGGPSLADLASVVSENIAPVESRELLARVTFNVAIGNADAHARNYSVLLHPDGRVALAPMYDVVCTRAFAELDTDPAQLIGGVSEIDNVTRDDLVTEGRSWGLPAKVAQRTVTDTLERLAEHLSDAAGAAITLGADPSVTELVTSLIEQRLGRLRAA